jgi:GMP synthase-like glutamine amidotransferase
MHALAIVHQADAGPGVFTDAIAEAGWDLETWSPPTQPQTPDATSFDAVLTFGGAVHPDEDAEHPWLGTERQLLAKCIERDIPLLGVCLGSELVAQAAGGNTARMPDPEIGWYEIAVTDEGERDPLLASLSPASDAFQWHSYECLPQDGAVELARSDAGLAAFRIGERAWGIQFHAEVTAADLEHWIRDYRTDPDAVRIGIDPDALLAETRTKIAASNDLGAKICGSFLEVATAA